MHTPRFLLRGFRSARELSEPALGPLERRVMELLWVGGELSVQDACDRFGPVIAYTTVMTTLDRLFKKGLLTRRKQGRAYLYSAATTREEFDRRVTADVVDGLLERNQERPLPLLSNLVDAVGERDVRLLDELERLIRDKQSEFRKRRTR